MKNRSKALLLSLCAVMLVLATVFGTMAYLTDSDTVTNTFTVGNVQLKLDEAKTNPDGTVITGTDAGRTESGNEYHLLPGHTYTKDPTVTVLKGSEACYVRMIVKVENIDQLKAALPQKDESETVIEANKKYYSTDGKNTFLLQMLCVDETGIGTWNSDSWTYAGYKEEKETVTVGQATKEINCGCYEFRYVGNTVPANGTVAKNDSNDTVLQALFTKITVPGEIDNAHLEHLQDVKIVVTAHAMQADGFTTAEAAWEAFK